MRWVDGTVVVDDEAFCGSCADECGVIGDDVVAYECDEDGEAVVLNTRCSNCDCNLQE